MTGQSGSIVEGKSYDYLYKKGPDNYVDYIGANGGTIFFKSQDNLGRAVNYGGQSNTYRAIHSAFIFGALRGGSSAKNELMAIYMNYLLGNPGIAESHEVYALNLTAFPNPFKGKITLNLSLSKDSHVCIKVYNTAGQMVGNLLDKQLPKGHHQMNWHGKDETGKGLSNGVYLLRAKTDEEVVNRVVILVN